METLISDCLPPIFSYLSISDLLHLRSISRRFKQEVDDHLPRVRSLPLYLATPRTPEGITRFEQIIQSNQHYKPIPKLSDPLYIRRLRFGISGLETFEDGTILRNQNHFRLDEFLIINDTTKVAACLQFMQKHSPNIEKLALVIDDRRKYLPEVSNVLKTFPALKVLLMESTLQESCRYGLPPHDERITASTLKTLQRYISNQVIPAEVYDSILAINNLEELYFFSKRQSQLCKCTYMGLNVHEEYFIKNVLSKLRVFHFNTYRKDYLFKNGQRLEAKGSTIQRILLEQA